MLWAFTSTLLYFTFWIAVDCFQTNIVDALFETYFHLHAALVHWLLPVLRFLSSGAIRLVSSTGPVVFKWAAEQYPENFVRRARRELLNLPFDDPPEAERILTRIEAQIRWFLEDLRAQGFEAEENDDDEDD